MFPSAFALKNWILKQFSVKDKIPLVQNTQPGKEGSDDGERCCYSPFPSKTFSLFIWALKWALQFPRYEVCWAGFGEKVGWGQRNFHPLQLIWFSLLYMVFELLEQQRGWGVFNLPLSPLRFPLQMRSMATSFLKWRHEPVDCSESSSLFYLVIFYPQIFFFHISGWFTRWLCHSSNPLLQKVPYLHPEGSSQSTHIFLLPTKLIEGKK